MAEAPRSPEQRKKDALYRLEHDIDLWVASSDADGPYLVPLSFLWDGSTLLLSTPASSPTGRNLVANNIVRLGLGPTRDVVLIEGTVESLTAADLAPGEGDAFAAKTGFDPRADGDAYHYYRVRPLRLQVWREANELKGRTLMREGAWIVPE
ncbi:pyridoxamine 5'-phosphate oxidase family protein [Actinomadura barringtoniae]|uniref:Pyridoxamine 5'-phosphate oxidase family protein n=1 Tax=Actinomadura barringtoniae TaxID=1427535 RepID=A0A939P6Y2_9ACTN|nr:pyridoxamine 5'-phosphate oxidase family protein [Actinomadura barringtoniae]MBO2446475.1 pyridoxamine 5'-phosphate oxidase family protein [Actinomadura barringtoniae]